MPRFLPPSEAEIDARKRLEATLNPQQREIYKALVAQDQANEEWSKKGDLHSPSPGYADWSKLLGGGVVNDDQGAGLSKSQVELFRQGHGSEYLGWLEAHDGSGGWGRYDPPDKKWKEPGKLIDPRRTPLMSPDDEPSRYVRTPGKFGPEYTNLPDRRLPDPEFGPAILEPRRTPPMFPEDDPRFVKTPGVDGPPKLPKVDPSIFKDPDFKKILVPGEPAKPLPDKFKVDDKPLAAQQGQAYLKALGYEVGSLNDTAKLTDKIDAAKRAFAKDNGMDVNDLKAVDKALQAKIKDGTGAARFLAENEKGIKDGTASKDDVKTAQWLLKGQGRDMPKSLRPDGTMDGIAGRETRTATPEVLADIKRNNIGAKFQAPDSVTGKVFVGTPGINGSIPDLSDIAGKLSAGSKGVPDLTAQSLMLDKDILAILGRPSAVSMGSVSGVTETGVGTGQTPGINGAADIAKVKLDTFKP